MVVVERCPRCDLLVGQCEHTRAAPARRAAGHDLVLVSPAQLAHLPGCFHNDEEDFSRNWGEITGDPNAWERIGNGIPVPVNGGADRRLVAKGRCKDCVGRG